VKISQRLEKRVPLEVGPPKTHHQHLPDPKIEGILFFRSAETAQEG